MRRDRHGRPGRAPPPGHRLGPLVAGLDWCRARPDVHKATLSVWPHNTAALALYRRHGFVVEGRLARHVPRRDGTLWDLVLMALPLAPEP
ncbi:MAG TPA: hypothetical protein VFU19_03575 [Iamia sp.]|nr:hypothetical protein [Iamia sp.]